jgi:lipid-binding SYLF domain-containing protein
MKEKFFRILMITFVVFGMNFFFVAADVLAATAEQIDKDVDRALEIFEEIKGSDNVLDKAKGLLVFPIVLKGGFGIGGEFGEGALRVDGKTVDYYNTVAASIGFQLGGQKKTIIIAFLDDKVLDRFRDSSGWKIGADASIAVVAIGAGGAIDSASLNEPIVAVVFGQKGLMYNLTLEGAKITRIRKN